MTNVPQRFFAALADYPDGSLGPDQLCLCCVKVLPVDHAAITISIGGESTTWEPLGASDELAARLQAKQLLVGEGPAMDAITRGGPVVVDDLSRQFDRWPGFAAALGTDANRAMYAFPLQIGAISMGVLELCRDSASPLQPQEMMAMLSVVDIVTMVLLSRAPPAEDDSVGVDVWWAPMPSSTEIHQATGMVVAQLAGAPRIAYLRLRAYA